LRPSLSPLYHSTFAAWTIYYQQQSVLQQRQQQQVYLQQRQVPPPLHPPVAPPAAAATAAAPSAATSVEEWPPSFKDFVSKCFATCTTADNKALLTQHLRTLTQQSKSNKTLHSTDWSLQPIINAVEIEAAERAKNAASVKVPPPAAAAEPKSWLQAAKKGVSLKWGPEMGAAAPAIPPPPATSDIAARLQFKPSKKDREGFELDAPLTKVSKKQQKADAAKGKKSVGAGDEMGGKPYKRAYDATNALLDDIAASFITEVVKGTSEQLEKPYMRQQMQPLCSEVRPERVLIRSIALMKDRHAKGAQYDYISEQMKSIRQVPRHACHTVVFTVLFVTLCTRTFSFRR
jgi:SAC3 family protein LENG8/THP3